MNPAPGWVGKVVTAMLGREYLARQVRTLLKMARITRDPKLAASLAVKASDLQERLGATPEQGEHPAYHLSSPGTPRKS